MFRHIQAIYICEWLYPPKPTAADFDAVEELLGIKFPASYRAFGQEFGLGGTLHVLADVLCLTRPPWADSDDWTHSLLDATRSLRAHFWDHPDQIEDVGPADLTERMVVFAIDGAYHTFVFDPPDVTDTRWHECRIYDIRRDGSVEAIADSFADWLQWIDARYRSEDEEEEEEEEETEPAYPIVMKPDSSEPSPMPYERFSIREKRGPDERNAQHWLAWNNGAVRELARSIRDEGRSDTFAILADALEEAGCTNEDMLYSCRAGDPDIDGAWVLAVLLDKEKPPA
jgi:hypothetical protein